MMPLDFPIMKRLAALLFLPLLASAADLPLHPDEAKIIQGIIATEAVEVADLPGYAKNGVYQTIEGYGVAAEPPEPPPTPGLRREGSRVDEKGNS